MVTDMDDDQRRQLLCFWTSTSTVPAGASDLHFSLCTPLVNGAACRQVMLDPLIDWISHTRPQGYTNLQSLVKCLDHSCCRQLMLDAHKTVYTSACFATLAHTLADAAGGFEELSSKLKLQASSQGLPTSHTCFFQLNMPRYSSAQELTAAFSRATQESKGFGFG